jgi:S1-C subfamily serine protease
MSDNYGGQDNEQRDLGQGIVQIPPADREEPQSPTGGFTPTPPHGGPWAGAYTAAPGDRAAGYPPPFPPGPGGIGPSGWAQPNPYWAPPPSGPPARSGSLGRVIAVLVGAIVLIVAGVGIGHGLWHQVSVSGLPPTPFGGPSQTPSGGSGSGGPSDVSAIASKVDPGLVDINTTLSYQDEEAAGTGMVLTSSGEILTNNHVIVDATSISVTDIGNGQTYGASVVGYDITQDLAVLQLRGASGLQTVSIGNSSNVSVGESVVGIGNAGGTGGVPSSAGGSVIALNQSITASDEGDNTSEQLSGLIESNADIQPGDSGGPLVNANAQVLGIDTAASSGFQFQSGDGGGFSIPINGAIAVAKRIEAGQGSTTIHIGPTAFLGVLIGATNGIGGGGSGRETGAPVSGVVTGDPANEAGIAAGDRITSLSGTTVDSASDLTAALVPHHPGDKVQIGWTDPSGHTHTATVQLASGPPA